MFAQAEKRLLTSVTIIRVPQSKPQRIEKDAQPNVKMQITKVKLDVEFVLWVMKKGQGLIRQEMGWFIQPEKLCMKEF